LEDSGEDLIVFKVEETGNQYINAEIFVKKLHAVLYLLVCVFAVHSSG
jgi:hypothetical protein